ncbi:hypothetical protein CDN99_09380 [Roseateles aquatilis]|uniref:Uncharacterized protein n=1 Tax=Roseateles aquatilis TaxID=431061 RepID=A0A246JFQ9_9BURK|nr:hypothetical protein [Roseateles aquatilis]OWQ91368.1 hypothetical protein CDN99_09380 [Roseateles aquatilis]
MTAGADIAWVWDHQSPPASANAWAVTVVQMQLTPTSITERPRLRGLPAPLDRRVTPVVHVDPVPVPPRRPPDAPTLTVALNDAQQSAIVARMLDASQRSTSGWVQLDFEARPSQRDSYHALVRRIRAALPADRRLSVTVLAWQCRSAAWIAPIAADEVVPMFFRLGPDTRRWLAELERGAPALHPRCRDEAAGFAPQTTPPADWQRRWPRRYWFNLAAGTSTVWPVEAESRIWSTAPARPNDASHDHPSMSARP